MPILSELCCTRCDNLDSLAFKRIVKHPGNILLINFLCFLGKIAYLFISSIDLTMIERGVCLF